MGWVDRPSMRLTPEALQLVLTSAPGAAREVEPKLWILFNDGWAAKPAHRFGLGRNVHREFALCDMFQQAICSKLASFELAAFVSLDVLPFDATLDLVRFKMIPGSVR